MSYGSKLSVVAGLAIFVLPASAWAQVTAQLPYPHAATCVDFHHHRSNGTWSPKVEIQLTSSAGTVSLVPGNSFAAGKIVGSYDLGKWLDSSCHKSKEW
jgi:hypothetical protein